MRGKAAPMPCQPLRFDSLVGELEEELPFQHQTFTDQLLGPDKSSSAHSIPSLTTAPGALL